MRIIFLLKLLEKKVNAKCIFETKSLRRCFRNLEPLNFLKGTDFDTKKLKKQVQKRVVEFR